MTNYSKVEWFEEPKPYGHIWDPEIAHSVRPKELVARYNDLVDAYTTLCEQRRTMIDCIKHIGVQVKAAEIAVGKSVRENY